MARRPSEFVCQQCGAVHSKWSGRCTQCSSWNSITEESAAASPAIAGKTKGRKIEMESLVGDAEPPPRISTGIGELDRMLGGGLVPGSATLIGGDPGIGKSTLLLQMICRLASSGVATAYFSGEESVEQIRMRGKRLGMNNTENAPPGIAATTDAADITASLMAPSPVGVAVIDSIQTMYLPMIFSSPGTVSQVRASAFEFIRAAKVKGAAVIIVGHVTKDGSIAGPRVLEHMVDTVLHFEGDKNHHFRILRGVKNRFGPTDEIGVFEMTGEGLAEVANPSELFLADRRHNISGAVVFAGIEGTRPILVEIQALVSPSVMPNPRRNVVGWDSGRLSMLAAVLETRAGLPLSGNDIFLNVAGGVKITEPAADLAVAAALISAISGKSCSKDSVFFGEIGLTAEVRRVPHPDLRLKEAARLGFTQAVMPQTKDKKISMPDTITARHMDHLQALITEIDRSATPQEF